MVEYKDFDMLNIANIPNSRDKIENLLDIFSYNSYSLKEIRELNLSDKYGCTYETFRKTLNHSFIIGLLECNQNKYSLSKKSLDYYERKKSFDEYICDIIYSNQNLAMYYNIIETIIKIFPSSINIKSFYIIFSYIGKGRLDDSSIASTGRNLRAVFSLLKMANKILKDKNRIKLIDSFKENKVIHIKPIYEIYESDVINIKDVRKYISIYFTKDVTEKILQCMATYEYENYIWARGSLYKNNGELKNLNNEYITTLMIKERQ